MLKSKSVRLAAVALGAALLAAPHFASAQATDKAAARCENCAAGKNVAQGERGARGKMGRRHRGMNAEARLDRMAKFLNLTDDQKAKLKPLMEQHGQEARAIFQDQALTREQKREKFSALRKAQHEAVSAVLTPEQKEKMAAAREQMKQRLQNRRPGAGTAKDKS